MPLTNRVLHIKRSEKHNNFGFISPKMIIFHVFKIEHTKQDLHKRTSKNRKNLNFCPGKINWQKL